jgi:hypothetical protein
MKINAKTSICALFVLSFGSVLVAGGALAQTSAPVAWRADGPLLREALSPLPQFIQQDLGRGQRGWRLNRDDDAEQDHDDDHDMRRSGWPGAYGRAHADMMHPTRMGPGMMALGGARFHMRKGDSEIDVRCPADVRMNECVDAISKMLDRLGAMGAGAPR